MSYKTISKWVIAIATLMSPMTAIYAADVVAGNVIEDMSISLSSPEDITSLSDDQIAFILKGISNHQIKFIKGAYGNIIISDITKPYHPVTELMPDKNMAEFVSLLAEKKLQNMDAEERVLLIEVANQLKPTFYIRHQSYQKQLDDLGTFVSHLHLRYQNRVSAYQQLISMMENVEQALRDQPANN